MKLRNSFILTAACLMAYGCGPQVEQGTSTSTQAPNVEAIQAANSKQIISVKRQGDPDGRTVVLIPGLASSPAVWDETIKALSGYDLRVVHVAGFAGAAPFETDSGYTAKIAGAVNRHLTDSLGKSPVIIGHSLGGYVGMLAAMEPDSRITELIIIDSLPFLAGMFMPGTTPEQAAQIAPTLAVQMASLPRAQFDAQQALGAMRLVKTAEHRDQIINWGKSSDQQVVATAMSELLAADLRDDLSALTAEMTVLAAYDAQMGVPQEQIETLFKAQYANAPNHRIEIVDNSFHFIMFDQPEKFLEIIEAQLGNNP